MLLPILPEPREANAARLVEDSARLAALQMATALAAKVYRSGKVLLASLRSTLPFASISRLSKAVEL